MRKNKVKKKIMAGERVYGCFFRFPSLQIVEMMGILGFDYIFIDGEHGAFNLYEIEQMCIAADGLGLTPIARVPNIHPSTILRFLDRGVMGIIGPHISTKAEAEAMVKACKFPPNGIRSFAGDRIYGYETPGKDAASYAAAIDEEVLVVALLEDARALENLGQILTVEGLDVLYFGLYDLSFSLGMPGNLEHRDMKNAVEKAAAKIRASGKIYGPDLMKTVEVSQLIMKGGRDFLRRANKK